MPNSLPLLSGFVSLGMQGSFSPTSNKAYPFLPSPLLHDDHNKRQGELLLDNPQQHGGHFEKRDAQLSLSMAVGPTATQGSSHPAYSSCLFCACNSPSYWPKATNNDAVSPLADTDQLLSKLRSGVAEIAPPSFWGLGVSLPLSSSMPRKGSQWRHNFILSTKGTPSTMQQETVTAIPVPTQPLARV